MIDAAEIKRHAAGRWGEILSRLGGVDAALLDGKNHPCPKCGGTDRFSLVDADAGALLCRHCFAKRNGDGLAALQWAKGWKFPEVLKHTAEYLGLSNGHAGQNGNGKAASPPPAGKGTVLERIAKAKNCPADSLRSYGAKEHAGKVHLPMYTWQDGKPTRCSVFRMGETGKGMNEKDKDTGMFFPGHDGKGQMEAPEAGETWIVCEGVKDAAALHAMGYRAVGLPGSKLKKEWLEAFRGVNVIDLHDADQPGVDGSAANGKMLQGVAASVKIARLPAEITNHSGKDVRDVLREQGPEAVRKCIADATPAGKDGEPDDPGTVKRLSDAITERDDFAQDPGGKLYHFRGGVYRARGERFIKSRCKALLDDWQETKLWSNHLSNELVEFIRIDADVLWDRPPDDLLNVKNGLLRVSDRKLLPHSPTHLSAVQLPVEFDPAADCPTIKGFVETTFPADAHDLAWEIAAFAMLPSSLQKAVLLLGEGANGKSVYLNLITTFLGSPNCSGLALHRLEADKFSAARLIGKLANICPDLPSEHLSGTSIFKALVGGDTLVAEHKFRDSFEFSPFAKLIFSANHPPRSADASHAFFRRWICVPFDRTFDEREQIPRTILDAMLTEPKELSGLLNRALDAREAMDHRGGFSEPESVKNAMQDFRASTDPLAVWLDQNTIEETDTFVAKSELRAAYNDHAAAEGRPTLGNKAFGTALRRVRPGIEDGQRMVAGRYAHCYVGLGLRSGGVL